MSIESDLRKDGIEVIEKLDVSIVNNIAKSIADKLCSTFPEFNLNSVDLFLRLSRLDMYKAKVPNGMSEANYFYKNSSIYFNEDIPNVDIEEFAIHECIHHLQEVKNEKNALIRHNYWLFIWFGSWWYIIKRWYCTRADWLCSRTMQ